MRVIRLIRAIRVPDCQESRRIARTGSEREARTEDA